VDKQFWVSIAADDYQIAEGHTLAELTRTLFSYLSSTDPERRDDISYTVYANWLKREAYTKEQVRDHVRELLAHLEQGIGETESDSVFLRAFSILLLAEIVHNDNKKPLLEEDQVRSILARGLWYLVAERDPRGHIPVKGWAHALAHTADLILVLGRSRHLNGKDLRKILEAIAEKIVHATEYIYVHGEDERLACAIVEILRRGLIPADEVETCSKIFIAPDGQDWKGVYTDEKRNRAYQNTRNLLRSIYLELLASPEGFEHREKHLAVFFLALKELKPY
jgi:Protein of unknown function (DUF2785)